VLDGEHEHDEGAEGAHLALGEVQVTGGLVDDHHRQRHGGVDRPVLQPVDEQLEDQRPVEEVLVQQGDGGQRAHQNPRYALRTSSS
jgi:hypothetical protein